VLAGKGVVIVAMNGTTSQTRVVVDVCLRGLTTVPCLSCDHDQIRSSSPPRCPMPDARHLMHGLKSVNDLETRYMANILLSPEFNPDLRVHHHPHMSDILVISHPAFKKANIENRGPIRRKSTRATNPN
jgi:hypothetical protein